MNTSETLPMCADHVVHHIVELERKGIVTKRFDKERGGYVWQPTRDYTIQEIMENSLNSTDIHFIITP